MQVQVLPGARVPADGEVVAGVTHVDESMLTGESLPVPKAVGSSVIGGTVNISAMIQVGSFNHPRSNAPPCDKS